MNFEIDVLIIYSSRDNEQTGKNESGWVSQFRRFLELMLTQVLGEKPNILLKDEHDTMTSPNLDNAAVLIPILTKNFIQSGQCLDYIEMFFKAASTSPRKINRVFKLFKNPLTQTEQPHRLRERVGYDMYQLDPNSGEITEYTDYFSNDTERQYWMKLVDLAYDIYDTLIQLKGAESLAGNRIYNRKTIYLAETGHDMTVQRNIIKRELQRHGYLVLPNQTLVGNYGELEKIIQKDIEESDLSIHLISAAYGEMPEESDKSLPESQLLLAAQKSKQTFESTSPFQRLIWISPNATNISERQKSFIERIRADVESQDHTEILQMPIEDFKVIMREELLDQTKTTGSSRSNARVIYLMYDRVDKESVQPIVKKITELGFEVLLPEFDGDIMSVRKKHIENLINFDAAIIFREKVNEQWVRMKVLDLLKAPGYGRKKPIVGKLVLSTSTSSLNSDSFKSHEVRVIQGDIQKALESIRNFLTEFES